MNPFTSPQEAIAATEAEFERTWTEFANANGIKKEVDEIAFNTGKMLFRVGYMAGAKFISGVIVRNMPKQPEKQA